MIRLMFLSLSVFVLLCGCNSVSEELFTPQSNLPDSSGFLTASAAGVTLKYKVSDTDLHCILSADNTGWLAVGFNPTTAMKDANFLIGYVSGNSVQVRDDWGSAATEHVSDVSLGGTTDLEVIDGSEASGKTTIEFKIPLNSGDQYDRILQVNTSYTVILAQGDTDNFTSYHSAASITEITLGEPQGNNDSTFVDTTTYQSVVSSGITFSWALISDSLRCKVGYQTNGWVAVGFNPVNQMAGANFIIGYIDDSGIFVRDDWGTGNTSHQSDELLGGINNTARSFGSEESGYTEIGFTIPLNSNDTYDNTLQIGSEYQIILAAGENDNYSSIHSVFAFSSFKVSNDPDDGGGTTDPDSTQYLNLEVSGITFSWAVINDTLRCKLNSETTGWIAVGFKPTVQMRDANFIIGYVNSSGAFVRDDWGVSNSSHQSDENLGGSSDAYKVFGTEINGNTEIGFRIPLDSGDPYDQTLIIDELCSIILAKGSTDDFGSIHTTIAFTSFTVNNEGGGQPDSAITEGVDISFDNDILDFNVEEKEGMTFKWKIVEDSLRCIFIAPTSGWVAVGFEPSEEMQDANFIIGYVIEGITYLRDDFGITETSHTSDVSLGGVNNVRRVFGRETGVLTEVRFTIPLNSGDTYDRILIPGSETKVLISYGSNNMDDFSSLHVKVEDIDIDL